MITPVTANRGAGHRIFRVLWAIAALTSLVTVYFFFVGLNDGSVSSFNMSLWLIILCILGGTLFGSYRLRRAGHNGWALVVVMVVAVPGILFGLFLLILLLTNPSWN